MAATLLRPHLHNTMLCTKHGHPHEDTFAGNLTSSLFKTWRCEANPHHCSKFHKYFWSFNIIDGVVNTGT